LGERLEIVEAVIRVNQRQRQRMVDKIKAAVGGDLSGRTIAVLGLSFKPETDDIRDAPSVEIIRSLVELGAAVRSFDPVAMPAAAKLLPEVTFAKDAYQACEGAHAMVIVTEWNQFRMLDLERIRSRLHRPLVVDLRNVYQPDQMRRAGFEYVSVGR
jgi:UDPglucose 6-dehydrogenase